MLGLLALALLATGSLLTLGVREYAAAQAERATWQALAAAELAGQGLGTADERQGAWYAQLSRAAQEFGTVGLLALPGGEAYRTDNAEAQPPTGALRQARQRGQAATDTARLLATDDGTVLLLELPRREVADLTRQVTQTFGGIALLTLLLAGAAAWGLVGVGLRPLRDMAQQAGSLGDDPGARLAVPGPRDEVRSLAESLNRMLARLSDAFGRLSAEEARTRAFAADASHELRTPLAAVQGSLEVLERAGDDPAIRARLLANVRRETRRAARLVDDLLTLTRLDAGEGLQLEEVELRALLEGLTDTARDLAPHLEFALECPPLRVWGDRARLEGAVWNLVRNAISATPAGQIGVRAGAWPAAGAPGEALGEGRPAGDWFLCVTNPAELPPEFLPRLFDRFARGPGAPPGGAGLGLAIVQATARAHGGEAYARPLAGELGARLEVGWRCPVAGPSQAGRLD